MKKSANKIFVFSAEKNTAAAVVKATVFFLLLSLFTINICAQQPSSNDDFFAKLTERSKKIANTLAITDTELYNYTVTALASHYFNVNRVHDDAKAALANIKLKNLDKDAAEKMMAEENAKKTTALQQLHKTFLQSLNAKLPQDKIEMIKDGMTYNVLPITYAAYQKMILSLTDSQKLKIYDWLKEARELAMDEGSSDNKHKMFGKYKGKINNYLSAQGYNVKKEGEEWAKREAAAKEASKTQN